MPERTDVPAEIVARLREICAALPDAREEAAWVGVRWRIRQKTFAHVLTIDHGWPPAYARSVGEDGPLTLLMFKSSGPELDALRHTSRPFFAPVWRADEVGMVLEPDIDWAEIVELVTDSYCVMAPAKLRALVDRPAEA